MRKMLLILLLVTLVLIPVAAATEGTSKSDLAIGLNLGTNNGVGVQYRMDDFDIIGNVGFGFLGGSSLSVDAAANYKITEFDIEKAHFDVSVGAGAYMGILFGAEDPVYLAAIAPVGVVYSMNDADFPLDFYLRVAPGVKILPKIGFHFGGYLGALWRFN